MFGPLGDLAAENPIIAICVGAAALVSASAVVKLINFLRVDGRVLKDTDLHGGDLVAKVFHEVRRRDTPLFFLMSLSLSEWMTK